MPKRTFRGLDDLFQSIVFVRTEDQFPSAEAAFKYWAFNCLAESTEQQPGGTMPDETEVYNLYDLVINNPSQPGDIEAIRVRSRSEVLARTCAARHAGREGRATWLDPNLSTCVSYGPAHIQWSGVVSLRAHGSILETVLANHRVSSKSTDL